MSYVQHVYVSRKPCPILKAILVIVGNIDNLSLKYQCVCFNNNIRKSASTIRGDNTLQYSTASLSSGLNWITFREGIEGLNVKLLYLPSYFIYIVMPVL